jgi:hypothetical protein
MRQCNRNRKLDTSTAPTEAKSQEPAYSPAYSQASNQLIHVEAQLQI